MKRLMQTGLVATVAATMFSGLIGGSADVSAQGTQETYVSPTYGVTFEYDASIWSVFQENDGSDGDRVDFLGLESPEIRGGLMIQLYDTQTDADDCLASLVDLGLKEAEDPELREDDDGEPMEGSSGGYAYAAYTFLSEGVHVSSYFGCQEIGDDVGMIAFWLMANSQDFDEGLELTEPIIASVDDSNAHAAGEGDDDGDRDDEDAEDSGDWVDDDRTGKNAGDRNRDALDELSARIVSAIVAASGMQA